MAMEMARILSLDKRRPCLNWSVVCVTGYQCEDAHDVYLYSRQLVFDAYTAAAASEDAVRSSVGLAVTCVAVETGDIFSMTS